MRVRKGESFSQAYERILSRNPKGELTPARAASKAGAALARIPVYHESISSINSALDQALEKAGARLIHYIDQAVPYDTTRQFVLETTNPDLLVAVQIYRRPSGVYEMLSYGSPVPRRGRHRNPEGDWEELASNLAAQLVLTAPENEAVVIPLPDGRSIAIRRDSYGNGYRIWEFSRVLEDEDGFRRLEYDHAGRNAIQAFDIGELNEELHKIMHGAAAAVPVVINSRRRRKRNQSDEPPTEIEGIDVEAGVDEEPPRIVDTGEAAQERYEEFHGRPSDEEILAQEEIRVRENLGVVGRLVQLICECVADGQIYRVNFGEDVLLCVSADGRQLYVIGGDQSLDLESMGFSREQREKDKVFIGSVQQVTYRTRKSFDNFAEIDYVHDFGEEGGTLPALVYDRLNQTLEFAGGDYEIKPEGIVN